MAQPRANLIASAKESMTHHAAAEPSVGPTSLDRQAEGRRRMVEASVIRIDRIIADPDQPRKEFDADELQRLGASIRERGQLQPIRVRWDEAADRYVVVVGERRWRAAAAAGLETLAAIVSPASGTPDERLEDQLVENCLREGLKPIEQARAYKRLMESRGLTVRELADRLRVSHPTVVKAVALLELPGPIQARVDAGEIAPSAGYQIAREPDPARQAELAAAAAAGSLRRDDLAKKVRRPAGKGRGAKPGPRRSHVLSFAGGKVTVDLRKAGGDAAALALIDEAAAALRRKIAEQAGASEAA